MGGHLFLGSEIDINVAIVPIITQILYYDAYNALAGRDAVRFSNPGGQAVMQWP